MSGVHVDDVTQAMQHMTMSPDATLTPRKRHSEATEVEPILVESPSKRHRGKQSPTLTLRRNPKLCQAPDCVFNSKHPGTPAWCPDTAQCLWCDPAIMGAALQEPGQAVGIRNLPIVLRRSM